MPLPLLMLDSGPLGKLAHRNPSPVILDWQQRVRSRFQLVVPEIADYEVRRELLAAGLARSVERLDALKSALGYIPITTATMLKAAELWADARRHGRSTAGPKALDGDVILAAQALEAGAIVATENIAHLSRYVRAEVWSAMVP